MANIKQEKEKSNMEREKKAVKLSSYKRMKQGYEEKIRQLTDDIITLVEEKDIEKITSVRIKWVTILEIEKTIWLGDAV
jgi:hypothetical protein